MIDWTKSVIMVINSNVKKKIVGFFSRKRTAAEKRVPTKEGEDGYDPYDFDESEATASEGKEDSTDQKYEPVQISNVLIMGKISFSSIFDKHYNFHINLKKLGYW